MCSDDEDATLLENPAYDKGANKDSKVQSMYTDVSKDDPDMPSQVLVVALWDLTLQLLWYRALESSPSQHSLLCRRNTTCM